MFVALAILCFVCFIFSFSLLFKKQLGKFFGAIKKFFSKIFKIKPRKEKSKNKRLNPIKTQPKLLPNNSQNTNKTNTEIPIETPEKSLTSKFNSKEMKDKKDKMDNVRSQIDEELKNISKTLEKPNPQSESISRKDNLPLFVSSRVKSDENAILTRIKREEQANFSSHSTASEIEIDGDKIDLSKLPTHIKKLLISGILDRKDF